MTQKNTTKYLSYRYAWQKINQANDSGFHLEAVTICESIISDRIQSYLSHKYDYEEIKNWNFSNQIKNWKKVTKSTDFDGKYVNLIERVDEWRKIRNDVIHSIAKSEPKKATMKPSDFNNISKEAGLEGADLARLVSNWHRSQLKNIKN